VADNIIEELAGLGVISTANGSILGEHRYHLMRYQRLISDGRGEHIGGGLTRMKGSLLGLTYVECLTLSSSTEKFRLTLKDGRSMLFVVSDNTGTIEPQSGLE
jgi:hypothetical protein